MPPLYKYFSPEEAKGMSPDLMAMADLARAKAGVPFIKLSGYRTAEQNKKAGGAPNSAHLTGLAMDVAAMDGYTRFRIVKALLDVGFKRIEVSKDGHVHFDIGGKGYPQEWLGIE